MIFPILKHKKVILIIAVLIVITGFAFWYRSKSKIDIVEVPEDNVNDQPSETETEKANELARAMFSNFENYNAFNFWYRPFEPFKEFIKVSDKVFVMTYNRFNTLYSGNGSLREWFNDDAFSKNDWEFIETIVFPRMDRLNLN